MVNKVIEMGRITSDLELKQTPSGKGVLTFSIAVDDGYGEHKKTNFFKCIAWGKTAEFINKFYAKGALIHIIGKLDVNQWTDQNGVKRNDVQIVVLETSFTGEKPRGNSNVASGVPVVPANNPNLSVGNMDDFQEITDEDLPF